MNSFTITYDIFKNHIIYEAIFYNHYKKIHNKYFIKRQLTVI